MIGDAHGLFFLSQKTQHNKKSVIFLARKDIDDLMAYIEKIPLHTVNFTTISPFIGTAMEYPILKRFVRLLVFLKLPWPVL